MTCIFKKKKLSVLSYSDEKYHQTYLFKSTQHCFQSALNIWSTLIWDWFCIVTTNETPLNFSNFEEFTIHSSFYDVRYCCDRFYNFTVSFGSDEYNIFMAFKVNSDRNECTQQCNDSFSQVLTIWHFSFIQWYSLMFMYLFNRIRVMWFLTEHTQIDNGVLVSRSTIS